MILARSRMLIPEKLNPENLGVTHQLQINEFHDNGVEELETENQLILKFDDSEFPADEAAITLAKADRIVSWLRRMPEEATLLITCFAGSSRSTACAAIAHCISEYKATKKYPSLDTLKTNLLHSCVGFPSPNGLVLTYGDQLLKTNVLTDLYWALYEGIRPQ